MCRRVTVALVVILTLAASAIAQRTPAELPDLADTGVVVPWQDFKKILEELRRPLPTPTPQPPPVDFALSECQATAVVDPEQQQVRVSIAFQVEVLDGEGWVEVPVIGEGIALASVSIDGGPARLYRKGGWHTIALRGAGRHRLVVDYLVAVADSRGTRTAYLRFPPAPVVTIDLRVPRRDVDVQVDDAVVASVDRSAAETRVRAALGRSGDTSVSWFARVETDDRAATTFAELATLVSIGEGVLRGATTASYTVHGRGTDTFRFEIPADLTVLGVDAGGLRQWQVAEIDGQPDRQLLSVELNYLAQGAVGVSFTFERPLAGATAKLELPDIAVRDVLRERGFLAVAAATNVEITPGDGISNAAPVDPSELPPVLVAGSGEEILYGFKYLRHPVVVPLEVVKHGDVAVKRTIVEAARLQTFTTREGKLVTSARYWVKNNRKQYLELALPDGATLWGAYLEDRPVKAARRDDGAILVPLRKTALDVSGELRSFPVEVVYFMNDRRFRALGGRAYSAPVLDVDVLALSWDLYLPRERSYFGFAGNLDENRSANRLVAVGGAVYNLANVDEATRLRVLKRGQLSYLTDGANEAAIDDVRVDVAGEKRPLTAEDLEDITGGEQPVPDMPAEAPARQTVPEPMPERSPRERSQVAQNVPRFEAEQAAATGGGAVGVLPVRIPVPTDGVRLSFTGRLLTASERGRLTLRYAPASWRLPRFGRVWAVLLGFALSLILVAVADAGRREATSARLLGVVVAAVALLAVLVAASGHRIAFVVACAAAVVVYGVVTMVRGRSEADGGF